MKTKKLNFYSISTNEKKYSEFINYIRNPEHKRIAFKFKIGNHKSGRLTICKTPEDLRICDHYSLNCWKLNTLIISLVLKKSLFTKMNDEIRYLQIKILMIKSVFFLILILIRTCGSLLLPSSSKHLRDERRIMIIIIDKLSHSIISVIPLQSLSWYYCISVYR